MDSRKYTHKWIGRIEMYWKFWKLRDSSHAISFLSIRRTYGRKEEANAAISRRTRFVFFPITRGKRVYFIIIGPAPDYNREGPSRDEGSRRVIAVGRGLLFGGIRCLETVRWIVESIELAAGILSLVYRLRVWSWLLMDRY